MNDLTPEPRPITPRQDEAEPQAFLVGREYRQYLATVRKIIRERDALEAEVSRLKDRVVMAITAQAREHEAARSARLEAKNWREMYDRHENEKRTLKLTGGKP